MCVQLFQKACTRSVVGICAMNEWMGGNGVNMSGSPNIPG